MRQTLMSLVHMQGGKPLTMKDETHEHEEVTAALCLLYLLKFII
jgi:hypothetical protein